MAELRPDLGALLDELSPYIEGLTIAIDRVAVTVAPPMGRSSVTFARQAAQGEDLVTIAADAAHEAAMWLNAQVSVRRKINTDTARPALELEAALARLLSAFDALGACPGGVDQELAVVGAREALAKWGSRP